MLPIIIMIAIPLVIFFRGLRNERDKRFNLSDLPTDYAFKEMTIVEWRLVEGIFWDMLLVVMFFILAFESNLEENVELGVFLVGAGLFVGVFFKLLYDMYYTVEFDGEKIMIRKLLSRDEFMLSEVSRVTLLSGHISIVLGNGRGYRLIPKKLKGSQYLYKRLLEQIEN